MTNSTLEGKIFRDAAEVTRRLLHGENVTDVSPVEAVGKYLDSLGTNIEEFAKADPVDRTLLWIGGQEVTRKKARTEQMLFSIVREVAGASRRIRNANGKLRRAHCFFDEIGKTCT